jgi:hypothetical protein
MEIQASANDAVYASRNARSLPVLSSLSTVRGYPSKLKIYRINGSRFWQARCFMQGKMYVRSTRTADKREAIEAAKKFYEELIVRVNGVDESEVSRLDAGRSNKDRAQHVFPLIAQKAIEVERGRMFIGDYCAVFADG